MGLFGSGDSGGDSTIISIALVCTVISLVVTFGVTALLPASADYDFDELTAERQNINNFTGDTMLNTAPWAMSGVFTPWVVGTDYNLTSEGFLYGENITDYPYLYSIYGKTTELKLDPKMKSSIPLSYGTTTGVVQEEREYWYANLSILNPVLNIFNLNIDRTYTVDVNKTFPVWNYTGYRYEFDPMLPFENSQSAVDGKLSIVWYSNNDIDGISGGLVIYGRDDVLLANIDAGDILANYNSMSAYSTRYRFDFDGSDIYLNIRFDPSVINGSADLQTAWNNGDWSLAITSPSAGNFLDVRGSTSFTSSLGNMVETFKQIFTFNLPNLGDGWNLVLWLLVSFPAELALLLFCSKLGIAGIPAAILGNMLVLA